MSAFVPHILLCFERLLLCFVGGQISQRFPLWSKLTSDKYILQLVQGTTITFLNMPLFRTSAGKYLSISEYELIQQEGTTLLGKKVIVEASHEAHEFISPLFFNSQEGWSVSLYLEFEEA